MSHFTRLKTRLGDRDILVRSLEDLGYTVRTGDLAARGFAGQRTSVEVLVSSGNAGYDLGFRKRDGYYELIADWWGISNIQPAAFLARLAQRYAYHVTQMQLQQQGFSLVTEEAMPDGALRLVLRRIR